MVTKTALVWAKIICYVLVVNALEFNSLAIDTVAMNSTKLSLKIVLNAFGISLALWWLIALSHLLTSHFDALNYQTDKTLQAAEFGYYGFAYSSWAFLCTGLYCVIRSTGEHATVKLSLVLAALCILIWLPLFFLYDAFVLSLFFNLAIKPPLDTLAQMPKALYFLYSILSFFCVASCTAIVTYQRSKQARIAELAIAKKQAETALAFSQSQFQLLQSQMSPHFLFNCLSAISALVRTNDKEKLLSSISKVGALLRYTANVSKVSRVLLEDEIKFVNDYIELQKLRFEERFIFDSTIEITKPKVFVIPMLIQPLIENTFHHGVAQTQETVTIKLSISQTSSRLFVSVENSHPNEGESGWGLTLENLKSRLEIAYPSDHFISVNSNEHAFCLKLDLPLTEQLPHA